MLKCLFYSGFLKNSQKFAKQKAPPPQNDNFSHLAKHRFIKKKNVMLQPPFWPKIGVFELGFFWNQKQWCWTTNITLNQEKRKIRKKYFKDKTRQETKKKEHIHWKQRNFNFIFSCCSIHETKNKEERTMKKETKTRNKKKTQGERQEGRKKDKRKKRDRKKKKKTEKGEAKKG